MKADVKARSRGGRPSPEQAEQIGDKILDAAKALFFTQGYGATSIEAIAKQARISKRTFYARYKDKADLFQAVVHRVVASVRPPDMAGLFVGASTEEVLRKIAPMILRAIVNPEALALHRLLLAEANRFPELALAAAGEGTRQKAVTHLAALLQAECDAGRFKIAKPAFAAEQFLQMIISLPQRRALGMGVPMTQTELADWAADSVTLFLKGCEA